MLTKDISIGELVAKHPFAVQWLFEKGIRCIRCGEPVWGTLESAALEKGFNTGEIAELVSELDNISQLSGS